MVNVVPELEVRSALHPFLITLVLKTPKDNCDDAFPKRGSHEEASNPLSEMAK